MLIENFKVGGLAKFGLDYKSLAADCPRLIYCSVTGFGQDGPYAPRAGYDLMAQGMGGFMSLTGTADGEPTRAGVPVSDIFTGVYSVIGILAALQQRERTGKGCYGRHRAGRLDRRRAGQPGPELSGLRQGAQAHRQRPSQHRAVSGVPVADGYIIIATGNDSQYVKLCGVLGAPELAKDPAYIDNKARLGNRAELVGKLTALIEKFKCTTCSTSSKRSACRPARSTISSRCSTTRTSSHRGMKLELPSAFAKGGTIPGIRTPIMIDGEADGGGAPGAAARRAHRGDLERDRRRLAASIPFRRSDKPPRFRGGISRPDHAAEALSEKSEGARDAGGPTDPRAQVPRGP